MLPDIERTGLSLTQFRGICDALTAMHCRTIRITGGEPFTRRDLIEHLRARFRPLYFTLIPVDKDLFGRKDFAAPEAFTFAEAARFVEATPGCSPGSSIGPSTSRRSSGATWGGSATRPTASCSPTRRWRRRSSGSPRAAAPSPGG